MNCQYLDFYFSTTFWQFLMNSNSRTVSSIVKNSLIQIESLTANFYFYVVLHLIYEFDDKGWFVLKGSELRILLSAKDWLDACTWWRMKNWFNLKGGRKVWWTKIFWKAGGKFFSTLRNDKNKTTNSQPWQYVTISKPCTTFIRRVFFFFFLIHYGM